MNLREQPHASVLETVDQVELPQRLGAVERAREDPSDLLGELRIRGRRGQRQLAHVVLQVEVRVVDPVGVVEPERNLGEAPAQRGQQRQPVDQQVLEVGALEPAAGRRGRVDHRHAGDVPVLAWGLQREELRVEGGELAHVGPGDRRYPVAGGGAPRPSFVSPYIQPVAYARPARTRPSTSPSRSHRTTPIREARASAS